MNTNKAPDKIVLPADAGVMQFLLDDVVYIRKDALLEWAKEEQAKCSSDTHPYAMFLEVVIQKINSL